MNRADEPKARSNPLPAERSTLEATSTFLMDRYGPLLGKESLVQVLGFPSTAAFERYCQRGKLTLQLVKMPNRRGVFAYAQDVARYLIEAPERSGP